MEMGPRTRDFKGGLARRGADVPSAPNGPLLRVARRVPKIWTTPALLPFPTFFCYIFRDYATRNEAAESRAWA